MANLNVPNDIEVDTNADAAELQQNFNAIQNYVNAEVIHRTGEVAMTAPLLLPAQSPTAPNQAARKAYVDAVDTKADTKVTKSGDTMSGNLVVGTQPTDGAGCSVSTVGGFAGARAGGDAQNVWLRRGPTSGVGESFIKMVKGDAVDVTQAGNITLQTGPTVNYGTSSDYRLKSDVQTLDGATERLLTLRPVRFRWNADPDSGLFDGFLAHEVETVVPGSVAGAKDALDTEGGIDPQQLDTSRLVPLLVATVQELAARVAELEAG